jgi:hypothetical protein
MTRRALVIAACAGASALAWMLVARTPSDGPAAAADARGDVRHAADAVALRGRAIPNEEESWRPDAVLDDMSPAWVAQGGAAPSPGPFLEEASAPVTDTPPATPAADMRITPGTAAQALGLEGARRALFEDRAERLRRDLVWHERRSSTHEEEGDRLTIRIAPAAADVERLATEWSDSLEQILTREEREAYGKEEWDLRLWGVRLQGCPRRVELVMTPQGRATVTETVLLGDGQERPHLRGSGRREILIARYAHVLE